MQSLAQGTACRRLRPIRSSQTAQMPKVPSWMRVIAISTSRNCLRFWLLWANMDSFEELKQETSIASHGPASASSRASLPAFSMRCCNCLRRSRKAFVKWRSRGLSKEGFVFIETAPFEELFVPVLCGEFVDTNSRILDTVTDYLHWEVPRNLRNSRLLAGFFCRSRIAVFSVQSRPQMRMGWNAGCSPQRV